jgi:hypothetical protein
MAQDDFILPVDDEDREAARGAADRIQTKSPIVYEALLDRLARRGLDPDASTNEVVSITGVFERVTAYGERAKRQVASEAGTSDATPVIGLFIGSQEIAASAILDEDEESEESEEDKLDDMPESENAA